MVTIHPFLKMAWEFRNSVFGCMMVTCHHLLSTLSFFEITGYYFLAETWFAVLFTVIVEIVNPEVMMMVMMVRVVVMMMMMMRVVVMMMMMMMRMVVVVMVNNDDGGYKDDHGSWR